MFIEVNFNLLQNEDLEISANELDLFRRDVKIPLKNNSLNVSNEIINNSKACSIQ